MGRMQFTPAVALAGIALCATPGFAQKEKEPLTDQERAIHVLSRLTYGPRPGDVERVLELGVDAWFEEQLALDEASGVERELGERKTLLLTSREIFEDYGYKPPVDAPRAERVKALARREQPRNELLEATALRAVFGDRQLGEVVTDFWRNHFNVSYTKDGIALQLITEWDAAVLRPLALGPFGDLLTATVHSPAMLHYLDNAMSKRPPTDQKLAEIERKVRRETGSREAGEAAAALAGLRGVNENYARELLELHTFGVDNGYKQEDVVALAEILTGWSFQAGAEGEWEFQFNPDAHVQGSKRFLRQRIQGDAINGKTEGDEVLEILIEHKRTADFLATKLCQRLVSDEPSSRIVSDVASSLRRENGDVVEAIRTILEHSEFWDRETYRSKIKTPQEFVYSALRATGAVVTDWDEVLKRLQLMNQPIYHCDDPTGWSDLAEAWLDPGILAQRWRFALDLANNKLKGVRLPPYFFRDLNDDLPIAEWSRQLISRVLPGGVGVRTQFALDSLVAKNRMEDSGSLQVRLLALILGSPEFQRQ